MAGGVGMGGGVREGKEEGDAWRDGENQKGWLHEGETT